MHTILATGNALQLRIGSLKKYKGYFPIECYFLTVKDLNYLKYS